jgi:hypothetical protein
MFAHADRGFQQSIRVVAKSRAMAPLYFDTRFSV